jgi:L-iditol 2-dehydrogenase
MRIAVVTSPGEVELRDTPVPACGDGDVLIRVEACGLCTMEARLFAGAMPVYPVAAGHEVSGRVERVGAHAAALEDAPEVGDLVTADLLTRCGACRSCRRGDSAVCESPQGGHLPDGTITMGAGLAEYVSVPASQVWPVGNASAVHAAMAEPLACVVHSLRRAAFRTGDRVTIIGAGYMGRLHLALADHLQARSVAVVETGERRRELARAAGASAAVAPAAVKELPRADTVFVTIASSTAITSALGAVADGGRIVLFGGSPDALPATLPGYEIHRRQLTITGSYSQEPEDWRVAAQLLCGGALANQLDQLVSGRYSLAETHQALEEVCGGQAFRVYVGAL